LDYDNYSAAKGPADALVVKQHKPSGISSLRLRVRQIAGAECHRQVCRAWSDVPRPQPGALGETDYSAALLAAASSGAQAPGVGGIAAGGADFINIANRWVSSACSNAASCRLP